MKLFLICILTLLGCCASAQHPNSLYPYVIEGFAQGTSYHIKYFAEKPFVKQKSIDSILTVIDHSMSLYLPKSLINEFNITETKQVIMDQHMRNVVRESFKINKKTKGFFDITILPLVKLWGFGPKGFQKNPTAFEVDSVRQFIGMNKIKISGNRLIKYDERVSIDLNGIAQGYSVDVLAQYLEKVGCASFIVELGGEIYAKGLKSDDSNFIVEIQRPYNERGKSAYKVKIEDKAITTSANYEKKRLLDGKFISHHIDPFTGFPVENSTISVTVIAENAILADALDNYFMYLKPEKAIAFVEKLKNVEIYILYSENNTVKELQSSGFNKYIYN